MATDNAAALSFHIEPELKDAARTAAKQKYHFIAKMVAMLIRESQAIKRGRN